MRYIGSLNRASLTTPTKVSSLLPCFTDTVEAAGSAMSMDSVGRAIDNIYIERFWRSVKYEDVYQKLYPTGQVLFDGLTHYIRFL